MFWLALEMARSALENAQERASVEKEGTNGNDEPSMIEQRNSIVNLLLKVADSLFSAKKYDEATGAYEEALGYHTFSENVPMMAMTNRNHRSGRRSCQRS